MGRIYGKKKIVIYLLTYVLSLSLFYGVSGIIMVIGCGLNTCYSCCIDKFLNAMQTLDFFIMMNLFAFPIAVCIIAIDIYDIYCENRKNEIKKNDGYIGVKND